MHSMERWLLSLAARRESASQSLRSSRNRDATVEPNDRTPLDMSGDWTSRTQWRRTVCRWRANAGRVSDSLRMRAVDSERPHLMWAGPSVRGRIDSAWVPCRFAA